MPDIINESGLTVKTRNEIVSDLETGLRAIFGADINLDQNSPDGQLVGIIAQAAVDIRELAVQINNGFDPDRAAGRILDERVVINNIERIGGTYTIQPVDITTNQTVTLAGLDTNFNNPNGTGFTVQDNAGNQFILVDTVTLTAGTNSLNFRAAQIGRVETVVNTITNPVTVVLGVTSINNSSAALQVGQAEETDAQLRVRRQQSVSLGSTGYLNGLEGAVLNLDGVTDAKLYENVSSTTDGSGIPAHGIWLIVEGGANSDIGNEIYERKSYGSDMKGAVTVPITTANGSIFTAKFDRPTAENLYIRFKIQRTLSSMAYSDPLIKQYMVDRLDYNIGQYAETSSLTALAVAAINANGGNGVPIDMEISKDGTNWLDYLTPTTLDKQFVADASRITITVI